MNFSVSFLSLFAGLLSTEVVAQGMNVTAISAKNNASVLECWELDAAPQVFASAVNYPIGNFENAFVGVIPPQTNVGYAHAREPQYSIFLSGLLHVRIPKSTLPKAQSEAWIQPGKYGILIAADTTEVSKLGHVTDFPGKSDTVIAQFPCAGGKVPEHRVLYTGPCGFGELIDL